VTTRDQELLDGLVVHALRGHLLGHRDADADIVGGQVTELDQRAERLVEIAVLLHSLRVRQEIRPRVWKEALLSTDLSDDQIRPVTFRNVADDLLADGDGVVGEVGLPVQVHSFLVVLDGRIQISDSHVEIPDAVVQADIDLLLAREFRERLVVLIEGFLPVLVLLVLAGLLLERLDAHSVISEVSVRPPTRAET